MDQQSNEEKPDPGNDTNLSPENTEGAAPAGQPVIQPAATEQPAADKPLEQPDTQPAAAVSGPVVMPDPAAAGGTNPAAGQPSGDSKFSPTGWLKKSWRKVALIAGAVVVVLGGSAAAFYTVYLPKQPWYVLDNALKNTMQQTQFTINTNLSTSSSGKPGLAFKALSLTSGNLSAKTLDENLNLTVDGFSIPVEARLVDQNLYIKPGDLSNISGLVGTFSPAYGQLAKTLAGTLSNHWFVVDSTLLDQNKTLKCLLNSSWIPSNSDSNYMVNSYLKDPFFTVNSMTNDSVNGAASYKLAVTLDHNKAAKFIKGLNNLQATASYAQCTGEKGQILKLNSDGKSSPMTIWVDKASHRIDKISYAATTNNSSGSLTATVNYNPVSIQAPKGAVSVMQLFLQLEQEMKANPALQSTLGPALSKL